jgi:molecular chaperone DnaK (HSP70)
MTTFGIDLGTTYSCIAYVDEAGRATVIKNALGEELTPSVVYFEGADSVVVGREAKALAKLFPKRVVSLIKREMGEELELNFHGETHTPETVSALILRELAQTAEAETGETVRDVVISVPAYFGVAQREATRNAGRIAGLNVLNVIPEPVAAALHYEAMGGGEDRTILVFDLGGGTFDTTVIKIAGNDVRVVCTDGNHHLGGADWDDKIADFLLERFRDENPASTAADSEEFLQELALAAEDIKKTLSAAQSRRYPMRFDGATCRAELTRTEFEAMASDLLQQTIDITERTIQTARSKGAGTFDDVLLVGGSCRVPAVAAKLRERFGFEPKMYDPDQAVAKGAALFALIESVKVELPAETEEGVRPEYSEAKVQEVAEKLRTTAEKVRELAGKRVATVVPRAFGVKVLDNDDDDSEHRTFSIKHILEANRPLPASPDTEQFYTAHPDQTEIEIEIWEQAGAVSSSELADNNKIGQGRITGLPPLPRRSPVDVTFRMSETGLLRVEAVELKTDKKTNLELQIQMGLSEDQVSEATSAIARYDVAE